MKSAAFFLANKVLSPLGAVILPKRELTDRARVMSDHGSSTKDLLKLNAAVTGGLRRRLEDSGKTRWLEIGCGGTLEKGFHYIDIFPEGIVDPSVRDRYSRLNIVHAPQKEIARLGTFDLVRMQHVFEHFAPEEGLEVLNKCASLLNPGGYLLISTPDLKIHIQTYLAGAYRNNESFIKFTRQRVDEDAPDSFHFSVFAHSLLHERHLWCYDAEGLRYMLTKASAFDEIQELGLDHPLASFPFTHNRPEEDVCVLARRRVD